MSVRSTVLGPLHQPEPGAVRNVAGGRGAIKASVNFLEQKAGGRVKHPGTVPVFLLRELLGLTQSLGRIYFFGP